MNYLEKTVTLTLFKFTELKLKALSKDRYILLLTLTPIYNLNNTN